MLEPHELIAWAGLVAILFLIGVAGILVILGIAFAPGAAVGSHDCGTAKPAPKA